MQKDLDLVVKGIAPTGRLRAALNFGNKVLVQRGPDTITGITPLRPLTVCGIVLPLRLILNIALRPSLVAFSTAGGTSLALP